MRASMTIPGRFPGLNDYIAANNRFRLESAAMKRKHTDRVCELAQLADMPIFRNPVFVVIDWVEPNRRRDPDNVRFGVKFILDGLVKAGVLQNDSQRWILGIEDRYFVDHDRPRVQVTIYDSEGETESE